MSLADSEKIVHVARILPARTVSSRKQGDTELDWVLFPAAYAVRAFLCHQCPLACLNVHFVCRPVGWTLQLRKNHRGCGGRAFPEVTGRSSARGGIGWCTLGQVISAPRASTLAGRRGISVATDAVAEYLSVRSRKPRRQPSKSGHDSEDFMVRNHRERLRDNGRSPTETRALLQRLVLSGGFFAGAELEAGSS